MLLKILFMGKTNILNNLYIRNVILSSIAIIVAFNESFPGGIGITMAICTEEFLRKINDFAVLMTMGMNTHEGNFKLSSRALQLSLAWFFNVLTSLPMFFGVIIGGSVIHFAKPSYCNSLEIIDFSACTQSTQVSGSGSKNLNLRFRY